MRLKPFFSYYGSKHRIADHYPTPQTRRIVEPFAGSAAYACRWFRLDVLLIDANPKVAGVWDYLIRARSSEVLALPLLADGEGVEALGAVPQEARWLVGFWLSKGAAHPPLSRSAWAREPKWHRQFWGEHIRARIAHQLQCIRHWKVRCANYWDSPDARADWFVDPPYEGRAGNHYRRFGSKGFDYAALASWCVERHGQVMVCENEGAAWLPFGPFRVAAGMNGTRRSGISREALWHRPLIDARHLALPLEEVV
ncbi:MAG TPA: hypothetical protein VF746_13470 [Longimicrobium sp.]|jgi:hypothetical protein